MSDAWPASARASNDNLPEIERLVARSGPNWAIDFRNGSRAAVAGRLVAQPVSLQLRR
jgi:hypothetical protein